MASSTTEVFEAHSGLPVSRIVEIKGLRLSRGDISDYIAHSAAQSEPTHCPAICLHNLL